jgi:hypothetical protein
MLRLQLSLCCSMLLFAACAPASPGEEEECVGEKCDLPGPGGEFEPDPEKGCAAEPRPQKTRSPLIPDAFEERREMQRRIWEAERVGDCLVSLYRETHSDVDAVIQLFRSPSLSPWAEHIGEGAKERLEFVLRFTENRILGALAKGRLPHPPGSHFRIPFKDSGFSPELADGWLHFDVWGLDAAGNQVGHFLTALHLGYTPKEVVRNWANWLFLIGSELIDLLREGELDDLIATFRDGSIEEQALRLIVGHEKVGDTKFFVVSAVEQYLSATDEDVDNFLQAQAHDISGDPEARDDALWEILYSAGYQNREACTRGLCHEAGNCLECDWQRGNSLEDLRNSVRGYTLGQLVATGELETAEDVAQWIEVHAK